MIKFAKLGQCDNGGCGVHGNRENWRSCCASDDLPANQRECDGHTIAGKACRSCASTQHQRIGPTDRSTIGRAVCPIGQAVCTECSRETDSSRIRCEADAIGVLCDQHYRIAISSADIDRGPVIAEHKRMADIDRRAGSIALGIGNGCSQADPHRDHGDRIIRVRSVRVRDGTHLIQRGNAIGIDRQPEDNCPSRAADPALNHIARCEEQDAGTGSDIDQP